jgi:hypothetical protein
MSDVAPSLRRRCFFFVCAQSSGAESRSNVAIRQFTINLPMMVERVAGPIFQVVTGISVRDFRDV